MYNQNIYYNFFIFTDNWHTTLNQSAQSLGLNFKCLFLSNQKYPTTRYVSSSPPYHSVERCNVIIRRYLAKRTYAKPKKKSSPIEFRFLSKFPIKKLIHLQPICYYVATLYVEFRM